MKTLETASQAHHTTADMRGTSGVKNQDNIEIEVRLRGEEMIEIKKGWKKD